MTYSYETVTVEFEDGIAWVTLNRPEKRNAINPTLAREMADALRTLNKDRAARLFIITGAGKSFCAGMDLKETFGALADKPEEMAEVGQNNREWTWNIPTRTAKPVITMVNGHCFGGGFLPVMSCDIAIAGSDALFGLSEINWGHLPGGAVSKLVIEAMGQRMATYYALTGEPFGADIAEKYGLVTRAVPQAELKEATRKVALTLLSKGQEALEAVKKTMKTAPGLTIEQVNEYASAKIDQLRFRDKAGLRSRGITDFVEKGAYRPGTQSVAKEAS